MTTYRLILAQKAQHSIRMLCRVLQVARSAFHSWLRSDAEPDAEQALRVHIRALHARSRGTYGRPRLTQAIKAEGFSVNHKKIARLMREEGLAGIPKRRFRGNTTDSRHALGFAKNHLARDFTATRPNEKWVGDITYLPVQGGWLYLSVLIDLYSRKVVGWALADHMRTELCLDALRQAIALRGPSSGFIHHTDRGSQYASAKYSNLLKEVGAIASMSRKGNCWDNAVAESFFGTLKQEAVKGKVWRSLAEAQADITDFIHGFYNVHRAHSTNGGLSPVTAERAFHSSGCHQAA